MKSCFNVLRGFIAFVLTFLYWIFLSTSFIVLPLSSILKTGADLNQTLDKIRIEEQIVGVISASMDATMSEHAEENDIPSIDYSKVFDDEQFQIDVINLRREVINGVYLAMENNESFSYEIDQSFMDNLYENIFIQYFESLPVCDSWESADSIEPSGDIGCLPAPLAIANDIEVPDTVEVPDDFEVTDDLKFDSFLEQMDDEQQNVEPMVIEIDQETISGLRTFQSILKSYLLIFILVTFFSLLFIILIAPGFKVILILLGILNFLCAIVAAILWKLPDLFLSRGMSYIPTSGVETENTEISSQIITLMRRILNSISSKALIMALCIGIIGLLLTVIGFILPKKKKDESKEQSTGEDNSTK